MSRCRVAATPRLRVGSSAAIGPAGSVAGTSEPGSRGGRDADTPRSAARRRRDCRADTPRSEATRPDEGDRAARARPAPGRPAEHRGLDLGGGRRHPNRRPVAVLDGRVRRLRVARGREGHEPVRVGRSSRRPPRRRRGLPRRRTRRSEARVARPRVRRDRVERDDVDHALGARRVARVVARDQLDLPARHRVEQRFHETNDRQRPRRERIHHDLPEALGVDLRRRVAAGGPTAAPRRLSTECPRPGRRRRRDSRRTETARGRGRWE